MRFSKLNQASLFICVHLSLSLWTVFLSGACWCPSKRGYPKIGSLHKIYFGELTFYHGAGYEKFNSKEWEKKLGDLIILPSKN